MNLKKITLFITLIFFPELAFCEDQKEPLEQRAFVLAGYVPQFFYEPDEHNADDPFAVDEEEVKKPKEKQKYPEGILSYLKENGMIPAPFKAKFFPDDNALILTDTAENLFRHELLIRALFRPDMQLRAIQRSRDGLEESFTENDLFKKDRLSGFALLGDTTLRAFHGEVRKLEIRLEGLPEDHEEIPHLKKHLKLAKDYRKKAVALYLKSLEKEETLLAEWQKKVAELKQ